MVVEVLGQPGRVLQQLPQRGVPLVVDGVEVRPVPDQRRRGFLAAARAGEVQRRVPHDPVPGTDVAARSNQPGERCRVGRQGGAVDGLAARQTAVFDVSPASDEGFDDRILYR